MLTFLLLPRDQEAALGREDCVLPGEGILGLTLLMVSIKHLI